MSSSAQHVSKLDALTGYGPIVKRGRFGIVLASFVTQLSLDGSNAGIIGPVAEFLVVVALENSRTCL